MNRDRRPSRAGDRRAAAGRGRRASWERAATERPKGRKGSRGGKGGSAPSRPSLAWRFLKWGLVLGLWGVIAVGAVIAWYAYDLPDPARLAPAAKRTGVTLVTADGTPFATYGGVQGEPVTPAELPPHLVQAVLATEDRRFYEHFGLDVRGLARAAIANVFAGRVVQGGSTITQQLAKNLFLTPERSLKRKVQEGLLALWLERRFTKDEILAIYLNRVYFGAGAFGIDAAARTYFGKPARALALPEAVVVAGLLKAPSRYAPTRDLDLAWQRARDVLDNMVEAGFLSAAAAEAAKREPPALRHLAARSGRYFADWVMAQIGAFLNGGGDLTVVTTLDGRLQREAEQRLVALLEAEGPKRNAGQAAMVIMTPDGQVRAMVGGRDYGESQFNRATQAQRQPGSAFKPFVYLAAVEKIGLKPDSIRFDGPVQIGTWKPRNYRNAYRGEVNARQALAESLNSVAAQLARDVGIDRVIGVARRLGIASDLGRELGLALGADEVNLLELTAAYGAFANAGRGVWPVGVTEIRDSQGREIYKRLASGPGPVIDETALYYMNDMLSAVITSGTGRAAAIGRPAAGKTGTTDDSRDAWFIGYTADYVAGVWVGNDDSSPMKDVTGSGLPARLWHDVMREAHRGLPSRLLPGREPGFLDRLRDTLFGGTSG